MKIRNVAFIAALIGWIALAVYYVTPSESAVAKEIETAPKTVGETLSAIAQSLKHEGEEKRKQLRRQLPAFFYSLPRGSLKTATVA